MGTPDDALFVPDGPRFVPTELTRSPWGPHSQHGGAPAALLARAFEHHDHDAATRLVRMTVELVKPVPLEPLDVEVRTVRPGTRVQLLEASLRAGDVEVARAVGLRLHRADIDVPTDDSPPPPPPETGIRERADWPYRAFHTDGMELRFVAGTFMEPGPATAWFRLLVPVVAGEEPSPFVRAAAAADFSNGISQVVAMDRVSFINPDLTVHVYRPPEGEWVCVEARSFLDPGGAGVAESALYDRRGRIGRATQSLLLAPR